MVRLDEAGSKVEREPRTSILNATAADVKPAAVVIFAPEFTRRIQNPAFGKGLVTSKWASQEEAYTRFIETTVSPEEHFARLEREERAMLEAMAAAYDAENPLMEEGEVSEARMAFAPVEPIAEPTRDEFEIPAEVDAITWAEAITGELREVAEVYQVDYAESILADDVRWQYEDAAIRPMGPTVAELHDRLAARKSRKARHRRQNAARNRRLAACC